MIKFTVVTITFNAGRVLERTVNSVLQQDYPCIEHLIIDGASKDNTVALAQDYRERSLKEAPSHVVTIVSETDKGLYDAINNGLRSATGHYIVYMNAGDCYPQPTTLGEIAAKAHLNELEAEGQPLPAVVYGDTDWMDNEGNYLRGRRLQAPPQLTWRSFRHGMLVCHQAFYARTDIARQCPYDLHYRFSADVDWCIRVMKKGQQAGLPLVNVHQVVANYQREGQSTEHHRASLIERFHIMCHHYGLPSTLFMHAWFVVRAVIKR